MKRKKAGRDSLKNGVAATELWRQEEMKKVATQNLGKKEMRFSVGSGFRLIITGPNLHPYFSCIIILVDRRHWGWHLTRDGHKMLGSLPKSHPKTRN
jgi:hypothetical protein